MTFAPAFVSYEFAGRTELCLCADARSGRRVMLIPPLFDEMNRMRRMLVDLMQSLHELGISSYLPDLPGTNESLIALERVALSDWQKAVRACSERHQISHIASFRGGALIVAELPSSAHWIFSPVKGATILRTMLRTRVAAERESGGNISLTELTARAETGPLELAGNILSPEMFAQLGSADLPGAEHHRTVRLESDSKPCDARIPGSALWLRAEPDEDPAMSTAIARDIAGWMAS